MSFSAYFFTWIGYFMLDKAPNLTFLVILGFNVETVDESDRMYIGKREVW